MIDRTQILQLVPHSGRMCLLDQVLRWDAMEILCAADNHRDIDHPLRREGRLSALHLLEYGAQAMAAHGGLLASPHGGASPGMLVAARELRLEVSRLDDLSQRLEILARRQIASSTALAYGFEVHHDGRQLATGRVSVILQPNGTSATNL